MSRGNASRVLVAGVEGILCVAGCGASPPSDPPELELNAVDAPAARHRDSGASQDASPGDAAAEASPDGGDDVAVADEAAASTTIACYTEGNPTAICTLPVHCCFSDYSSQHDGYCTTDPCSWGTLTCDGPENCATGDVCCADPLVDATDGSLIGYRVACQAAPCGTSAGVRELCHTTGTSSGTCSGVSAQCVSAYGHDNDLPPNLYICAL